MTNEHLVELIPHIESALEDGYPLQLKGDDLRFLLEAIKARLSHEPNPPLKKMEHGPYDEVYFEGLKWLDENG